MALTADEIEKEALALPGELRVRLADRLFESLKAAEVNSIDELWVRNSSSGAWTENALTHEGCHNQVTLTGFEGSMDGGVRRCYKQATP